MPFLPRERESRLGVVLCAVLAAIVFELCATTSFHTLDLLLVVLAAVLALTLLESARGGAFPFIKELYSRLGGALPFLAPALLGLYLLYDFIGIFYSPVPELAAAKYKVVVLMLFISLCMLVYIKNTKRLRAVLLTLGAAAGAAALITVLNYLFSGPFPIFYTMRFTLRRDYNVFATTLLLGYLCVLYLFHTTAQSTKKCILFALDSAVTLTVLYLSGSRRVFMMLPPMLIFWLAVLLFRQRTWRGLGRLMLTVSAAFALFIFSTLSLQGYMNRQYEQYGGYGFGQAGSGQSGEGTPAERYQTVEEGSMLTKRKIIWGIAWDEYKSFTAAQKLFGKGFGYDIALYDDAESEELAKEYAHLDGEKGLLSAHNFLLADLLNGGAVKALLGAALLGSLLWACVRLLRCSFAGAAFYGNALLVVVLGSFISNRYGFLYDKFFYIFALLLLMDVGITAGEKVDINESDCITGSINKTVDRFFKETEPETVVDTTNITVDRILNESARKNAGGGADKIVRKNAKETAKKSVAEIPDKITDEIAQEKSEGMEKIVRKSVDSKKDEMRGGAE